MKRLIISITLTIIIFIFILGVFEGKENKKSNLQKLTVSEVAHSIFYTPLYVANNLGFFKEEGLDVDIVLTSGADAVAASILSGDADIGFCGSEQTIYIYNEGSKDYLINFAGLTKRDGSFIVSRNKETFKLENLIGKHIIAGREGGMPAMTLAYTLKENGIGVDDLNFDTSIAFASMNGAFIGGTGDYVTVFEPSGLQLEKEGSGYVVASLGKLGGEVPYTTFQAKKSYIENNPETIKKFNKALQKGIDYTFNHTDKELAKIISKSFPDTSLTDLEEVIKRYRNNDSWYKTTYITEKGFNRVQDIMENNGKLKNKVDYTKLVNNKYAKK